jgi:hypothetical protein
VVMTVPSIGRMSEEAETLYSLRPHRVGTGKIAVRWADRRPPPAIDREPV